MTMKKISPHFYSDAIEEFKNLSKDYYSINHLYWWMLKHEELYEKARETWKIGSCFSDLPCGCSSNSVERMFIYFYDSMHKMTEIHKNESYFEKELQDFHSIKDDKELTENWFKKNEEISFDILYFFIYQLYEEEYVHHPSFSHEESEFFVNRADYNNIISVLEIFRDSFWDKRTIPDLL
jgi:hypothetical protein